MSLLTPAFDYFVRGFHPGYMDSSQPDTLPLGATPDARNGMFASLQLSERAYPGGAVPPRATMAKRQGARLLTPAAVVASRGFDGLFEFRRVSQASGTLVGVVDGKVWRWTGAAFVQIGVTAPFVVGARVQFSVQRDLLFISDGTTTRIWDGNVGNDLFTNGEDPPTSAPALAAAAGPGVSGTFEGYAVWYDSVHDHETSPSALSAQVVLANQVRSWTKPTGAPAANYDKWRVYCRRIDTNEVYYKRVAEVLVATGATTEAMTDAARNLSQLGPLPLQNDKPPASLLIAMEFQGYRLAVKDGEDQVYVSKLGDPQSQHPTDVLAIARGAGGDIRSLGKFGVDAVIQKASRTYILLGDRMPFLPKERHSSFGNVGRRSTAEVEGWFYAWDEGKGPYRTDLAGAWEPIGTARVQRIIDAMPKTSGKDIECVYVKPFDLVLWAVPQGASTRRRTIIGWHTKLQSWIPPITGLEYACLATQVDTSGALHLYVGDYWGRLFQYFTDDVEGVPSGTLVARVLSSTSATVTCDKAIAIKLDGTRTVGADAAFYVAGNGLAGLPVLHIDANNNKQWRRIQSNTAGVLTLDTTNDAAWSRLPAAGELIVVGGIDWYWTSPLIDYGDPFLQKLGRLFLLQATPGSSAFRLELQVFREGFTAREYQRQFALDPATGWGTGKWGSMIWGKGGSTRRKMRLARSFFSLGVRVANPFPNQPVELLAVRVTADPLRGKVVPSGGTPA